MISYFSKESLYEHMSHCEKQSLKELFHVDHLDYKTRTSAGLIIDNHVYTNISHSATMRDYTMETGKSFYLLKDKYSHLHFIDNNIFIDFNNILTTMDLVDVVNLLRNTYHDYHIWLYVYKSHIKQIC